MNKRCPSSIKKKPETVIEDYLLDHAGYGRANNNYFNRGRCLDPPPILMQFIHETQPREWQYLEKILRGKTEETLKY